MIKTFKCEASNGIAVNINGSLGEIEIDLFEIGNAVQKIGDGNEKAMKRLKDAFYKGLTVNDKDIEAAMMDLSAKGCMDDLMELMEDPEKLQDFMRFMEKEGHKHAS